jgi:hypothetical protein
MSPVTRARLSLLAVHVIGGTAVLGSYAWGFAQPEPARLWGTLPEAAIGPYSASMPFAAIGYFFMMAWADRRVVAGDPAQTGPFAALLAASALWMPLCFWALDAPLDGRTGWLVAVQLDLAVTALASLWLLRALVAAREPTWIWRVTAAGWLAFCWQTVLLDAIVWPRFFGG